MRLIHFSNKVWHRRRGQKRVSRCVALEMGHRAGVVPGIEANPMWVLKSKSTQIRVFSSFPLRNIIAAAERFKAVKRGFTNGLFALLPQLILV